MDVSDQGASLTWISCKFGGVWGEERRARARMRATDDVHPSGPDSPL